MDDIYVGRQPIYDRTLGVHAYELLFRSGLDNRARITDGDLATTELIINTVLDIGLERLVGDRRVFINIGHGFLTERRPLPIPPDRLFIEILEDIDPSPEVLDALRYYTDEGYGIALDDFEYRSGLGPLVKAAQVIKLDIQALSSESLERHVEVLRKAGVTLLAEKVETHEEFRRCEAMGFELFQGYFFARPDVVAGKSRRSNRSVILRLMARLQDPETGTEELERVIVQDPSLTYRLLNYVNSPLFGLRAEVTSVRQAIVLLGTRTLRNWATLLLYTRIEGKPHELITTALVRARMLERLAPTDGEPDAWFTVGLLSVLDAMMDSPMPELLQNLPLPETLRSALVEQQGPMGAALARITAYETDNQRALATSDADLNRLREVYLEALDWARESMEELATAA